MTSAQLLPLDVALKKLNVTKDQVRKDANLSAATMAEIDRRGVTLYQAETISYAYGMHPSELWGDNWVDAILTYNEWADGGEGASDE